MLQITIVADGPFGERAYKTIKNEFVTNFIKLTPPTYAFADEIDLTAEAVKVIQDSDIIITYTLHPDLTMYLVERFAKYVDWVIVAAWKGEGFKKQLERFDNVICPQTMCELEEVGDSTFDAFVSRFGRPEVEIDLDERISDIRVKRCAPCGSTHFVADFLKKRYRDKKPDLNDLPREAGLILQHYPCRAGQIRLFTDGCSKDQASNIHQSAFKKALKDKTGFKKGLKE